MSDTGRMSDVRRYLLGKLDDAPADELASDLARDPKLTTLLADAAIQLCMEGGFSSAPRVATHSIALLRGLAPRRLALAADDDVQESSQMLFETFSGDGLETVVKIENEELVVFLKEESNRPVANAHVTLRLVGKGGRSERRAQGRTDSSGRISMGLAEFFSRPDPLSFYQISVMAPPKDSGK